MPISEYLRQLRSKVGHDLVYCPGVLAVVINDAGEVLVQHRSDNSHWNLIGGIMDPGEEPADAMVREVYEEAGVQVAVERLVGVYGGHDGLYSYPNGDVIMFL